MPFCTVCQANGKSNDFCKTHNKTAKTLCPYHPRAHSSIRESPSVDADSDGDDDVATDLQDFAPSPSKRISGTPSKAPTGDGKTAKELMQELFEGRLTKKHFLHVLSLRLADEGLKEGEERMLLRCIKAGESFDDIEEPRTETATEISRLQAKHGKLVGLLMASHRRVLYELHIERRSPNVRALYENAETGETLVAASAGDDVGDVHVLHLVLIDFVYVCGKYNLLTATEGRALHRWATKKIYLSNDVVVTHRTLERLLQEADSDPTADVGAIINADARALYDEELATAAKSGKRVQGATPSPDSEVSSRSSSLTPGDPSLLVPWPRRGMCWTHTNGKPCDLENGICPWSNNHDKLCGLRYKEGGTVKLCKGAHKAVDCPHKANRA